MYYCPYAIFLFLTAPIFPLIPRSFIVFSRTPAWFLSPCQLPGVASLHLIDLKYHFFSPTQELVNGSWYVSIVRINDFLYLCHGAGDRCQVRNVILAAKYFYFIFFFFSELNLKCCEL